MSARRTLLAALALATLSGLAVEAGAAPLDSKVGDVRVAYSKKGTVLRAEAAITGAPAATLPSGTSVQVLEVKFPWLRVQVVGQATAGWLKAYETVEPDVFNAEPPPAHLTASQDEAASGRDVSAAGRHFDSETERGFRTSRPDLERGYAAVDRMEEDNQRMAAADTIDFVMEGSLGRKGRDCRRPARLPLPAYVPSTDDDGGGGGGVPDVGGLVGRFGGNLLGKHAKDADRLLQVARGLGGFMRQMNKAFTPGQEYYLGRAVAANAIAQYGIVRDEAMRRHVRLVGDAVVRLTNRAPQTVGGYNFDVLDSDEVNGISGPGGFVLVTRGAVLACENEDELAGILCHEMAHTSLKHAEQVIRRSKAWGEGISNFTKIAGAVSGIGDARLAGGLVDLFSKAAGEAMRSSVEHNFGPEFENQADAEGTQLLYDVLYDHGSLRDCLRRLAATHPRGGSATHAPPDVRAAYLDTYVGGLGPYMFAGKPQIKEPRTARFRAVVGKPPLPPASPPTPPSGAPPPAPPPSPLPGTPR